MNISTIGVIGVGNMGLGMARALRAAGLQVLARDLRVEAERAAVDAGAIAMPDARALAAASDAILVVVVDAGEIEDALFREAAPASAGWRPGTPVLMCSTIAPEESERLAARIADAGGIPIDAPISGGPDRAARGELSFMLAGATSVLDDLAPAIDAMAGKAFRVSTRPGDGMRMKLINNLLAGVNLAAGAQALAAGAEMGLDIGLMLDVIGASSGQSWIVEDRMRRAASSDFAPRAHARILTKDLRLGTAMLATTGRTSDIAAASLARFEAALVAGLGEMDDAVLFELERRAPSSK